jgi:hypothetical protein
MEADPPEAMEEILDINDGVFEDCNRYQTKVKEDLKQVGNCYFAQVKGRINIAPYEEEEEVHTVYDITYPVPNLATHNQIMIEATNGVTHQKSRPLRRHELLTALGHETHTHDWTGHDDWTATYNRMRRTTPR